MGRAGTTLHRRRPARGGGGLVVFTAMAFIRSSPPTVDFTTGHQPGAPVNVTLQTVGSDRLRTPPDVGLVPRRETPSGQWVHTTLWDLPAHTPDQRDHRTSTTAGSPLRNQQSAR